MTTGWDTLDKGMIHVPGGTKQDSERFHHTTQNGAQIKTYALFISAIFHLIFLYCSWLRVTEIFESETTTVLILTQKDVYNILTE